jgi:hypothetical protein
VAPSKRVGLVVGLTGDGDMQARGDVARDERRAAGPARRGHAVARCRARRRRSTSSTVPETWTSIGSRGLSRA